MIAYYCGFNGFGQFPDNKLENIAIYHPTLFPLNVISISLAWNYLFFRTESEACLSGFINGENGKIQQLSIPTGKEISQASCSSKCALFITEDGCCWMYRSGVWKSISPLLNAENHSHCEVTQHNSQEKDAPGNHKIVQACCQDKISIVLCDLGQVYSIPSALTIPDRKVTEIACGFEHCLMLTDISTVYSWGSGRRGQLGHEILEDEDLPREVELLSGLRVKAVAAGGWHSVALTVTGDMYVWGWNTSGQLGMPCSETRERILGRTKESSSFEGDGNSSSTASEEDLKEQKDIVTVQAIPVPVNFPQRDEEMTVKAVACGNRHTVVLADDGVAWGCGWNAYGQLGLPEWSLYEKLTKITIHGKENNKIKDVVCGGWSTVFFLNDR